MDFDDAGEAIKRFSKKPPEEILLQFYGLYKQATVGDCNIPAPNSENQEAQAKYAAWAKHRGMLKIHAKAAYVGLIRKYAPEYQ